MEQEKLNMGRNSIILLCAKILRSYDERLIDHGERVAWLSLKIAEAIEDKKVIDKKTLLLLALFHDIGAYKTEEISKLLEFESGNVAFHSTYGYLFLKYFSPLGDMSEVILHHHDSVKKCKKIGFKNAIYSSIIHLADRLDIALLRGFSYKKIVKIISSETFDQELVKAFVSNVNEETLKNEMEESNLRDKLLAKFKEYDLSIEEAIGYLKMMVFTIDFKSPHTMDHSIQTTNVSVFLGEKAGLSREQVIKLYFATLIHDIGKVIIPNEILEYPGKLDDDKMAIMRTHVEYTEKLLIGVVPDEIVKMAARHHEKLNGLGYPRGISANDLSVEERIVAIADIFSALISKRNYKEKFDKDKTLEIIDYMVQDGSIDGALVQHLVDNYDELISRIEEKTKGIKEINVAIKEEFNKLN